MTSFAEQYRPSTLADFIGNAKAVQAAALPLVNVLLTRM